MENPMSESDVALMRNVAIVMANVARAYVKIEAMKALNAERADRGHAQAYGEEAFHEIINDEGIGWNSVIGQLTQ